MGLDAPMEYIATAEHAQVLWLQDAAAATAGGNGAGCHRYTALPAACSRCVRSTGLELSACRAIYAMCISHTAAWMQESGEVAACGEGACKLSVCKGRGERGNVQLQSGSCSPSVKAPGVTSVLRGHCACPPSTPDLYMPTTQAHACYGCPSILIQHPSSSLAAATPGHTLHAEHCRM